jgi:hypothetical protein
MFRNFSQFGDDDNHNLCTDRLVRTTSFEQILVSKCSASYELETMCLLQLNILLAQDW